MGWCCNLLLLWLLGWSSATNMPDITTMNPEDDQVYSIRVPYPEMLENSEELNEYINFISMKRRRHEEELEDIYDLAKNLSVAPDVADVVPMQLLTVQYEDRIFKTGDHLTPQQTAQEPTVDWEPLRADNFFTLILTGPDVPSRQNRSRAEWLHWLVVNIPGNHVRKGEVIAEYIGAGSLPKMGPCRHVFLLFQQPRKLSFDEPHLGRNLHLRNKPFSTKKFVAKYKLGDPLSWNLFLSENDHPQFISKVYYLEW